MKKLNLAVLLFVCSTGAANAGDTAFLKIGGWPGGETSRGSGETNGAILGIESTSCGRHCINPYFVRLSNKYGTHDGLGVDYTYKLGYRPGRDAFRVSAGLVGFDQPLNEGEAANFHLGVSFEVYSGGTWSALLSLDHFSNGRKILNRSDVDRNLPANLLSLGIRFQ